MGRPGLSRVLRKIAETSQRVRVNVTPHHFYSDIPDLRALKASTRWRRPFSMHGVAGADTGPQMALVEAFTAPYRDRFAGLHERAVEANGEVGYGPIESQFLYAYTRSQKPGRIVQVGCGVSTAVLMQAVDDEPGYTPEVICVEPFPTPVLRRLDSAGKIRLIARAAQDEPLERFTNLGDGGLLFVDSTHTIKVGSEVVMLIAEALPRLAPGARVHFHDIWYPYDYSPYVLANDVFFWRETVMLYAFLLNNSHCRIEASLAMLHHSEPDGMRRAFPGYTPARREEGLITAPGHFPSSIFLRIT